MTNPNINDFGRKSFVTHTVGLVERIKMAENKTQKPSDKDHRQQITVRQAKWAALTAESKMMDRLQEKGFGALVSRHEILGVLTEEYHEAVKAVESQSLEEVRSELIDLAVGCIFGAACIDAEAVDW